MNRYEPIEGISTADVQQEIPQLFLPETKLYAVLDFAVCFGIYRDSQFLVALEGEASLTPLNWDYLRELRIFDETQELLLTGDADGWGGRLRRHTGVTEDQNAGEYMIKEQQKLWGKAISNTSAGIPGWTTLMSGRGSQIQIPLELPAGKAAAIEVYQYMRIPNVERGDELVFQKDIGMMRLCPWEGGRKDEEVL